MDTEKKILKAKIILQYVSPFTYVLVSYMDIKPGPVPTAGINAKGEMFYSQEWFEKLTVPEVAAVLIHESLHLGLLHLLDREVKEDMLRWNIATDLVVNDIINDLPDNITILDKVIKLKLPVSDSGINLVPDKNHKWSLGEISITGIAVEKTAPQIYKLLESHMQKTQIRVKLAGARIDEHQLDMPGENLQEEIDKLAEKWQGILVEATMLNDITQGCVPRGLKYLLDKMLNPQLNWRQKLYKYISNEIFSDFCYSRPSKKSFAANVFIPQIHKEKLDIITAIDTSGSISDKEIVEFVSEIKHIGNSFENVDLTCIVCDAQIHDVFNLKGANSKKPEDYIKISGRGGTSHIPVQEHIEKYYPRARLVIALTDGYTCFPDHHTGDWIWVLPINNSTDKSNIPFGNVIKLGEE